MSFIWLLLFFLANEISLALHHRVLDETDGALFKAAQVISSLSYQKDKAEIRAELDVNGLDGYEILQIIKTDGESEGGRVGEIMGYVFSSAWERRIFVGYKGSIVSNHQDWTSNAWSIQSKLGDPFNLTVHTGFRNLAKVCYASLQHALKRITPTNPDRLLDYEIIFTGHSRGGALAILSAILLNSDPEFPFRNTTNDFTSLKFLNKDNNIKVITFNSPRVLSKDSYGRFPLRHENHRRIENAFDLVTRVPPEYLGYQHTGLLSKSTISEKTFQNNLILFGLSLFSLFITSLMSMQSIHSVDEQNIQMKEEQEKERTPILV